MVDQLAGHFRMPGGAARVRSSGKDNPAMHPNALLELATELIHRVLQLTHPADGVVSDFFRQNRTLGMRERHTLAETTYAVLRQRTLFQHLAQSGRGELERRLALLAWQGNEGFLRAALSETEQQWLAQVGTVDRSTLAAPLRHNLPEWLATQLQADHGADFWPLVEAMNAPAPLDLRVNTFKARREEVQAAFAAEGIDAQPTPLSPLGLRIAGKPALHKLAVFLRGDVEVQDEGSQLLALITGARRGEMVADFCAGAGGKTLALGAEMRNTGRLYAFDTSGHRLASLKPRLARSGLSNVYPVQIAHERDDRIKRLAGKLDRVLVDAPCTGLGTLRRNPDLKWRQTPASVAELAVKQAAILASAARLVKPGGRLVYATCSLLEAENEVIARAFTAEHGVDFEAVPVLAALEKSHVGGADSLVRGDFLRLWPHRHGTDGFFAAMWTRR
jgi:16S rRNA (cytosine967-C5)-methyltransferase